MAVMRCGTSICRMTTPLAICYKKFYQALDQKFSDATVEVDKKVFNAGRIWKLVWHTRSQRREPRRLWSAHSSALSDYIVSRRTWLRNP